MPSVPAGPPPANVVTCHAFGGGVGVGVFGDPPPPDGSHAAKIAPNSNSAQVLRQTRARTCACLFGAEAVVGRELRLRCADARIIPIRLDHVQPPWEWIPNVQDTFLTYRTDYKNTRVRGGIHPASRHSERDENRLLRLRHVWSIIPSKGVLS